MEHLWKTLLFVLYRKLQIFWIGLPTLIDWCLMGFSIFSADALVSETSVFFVNKFFWLTCNYFTEYWCFEHFPWPSTFQVIDHKCFHVNEVCSPSCITVMNLCQCTLRRGHRTCASKRNNRVFAKWDSVIYWWINKNQDRNKSLASRQQQVYTYTCFRQLQNMTHIWS